MRRKLAQIAAALAGLEQAFKRQCVLKTSAQKKWLKVFELSLALSVRGAQSAGIKCVLAREVSGSWG